MKLSRLALAVATLSSLPLVTAAQDNLQLPTSVVTGNRLAQEDFVAPYAAEIHNLEDIQNSGAISLYDYLGRFSSVNIAPSYGNEKQQLLDMRGYGIGDGHQNIVVTLNGRRLNNIDSSPQLLSNIPLASIERIEIIKGSGSVAHGDGAMAGTINIVTRELSGASLSFAAGNNGYMSSSVAAGLREEFLALEFMADNSRSDGLRDKDVNGKKDESDADNLSLTLKVFPLDGLELRVGRDQSRIETNYGNHIDKKQFYKDPKFNPSTTEQEYKVNTNRFGVSYAANEMLSFNLDHAVEKKDSDNITFREQFGIEVQKYNYRSTDFSSQINLDDLKLVTGVQLFDGERKQGATKTNKDNLGYYLQGQYTLENTILSTGVRRERVKYNYDGANIRLKDKHNLNAWDLGVNHQLNHELSLFANLSSAYQAPDIDRFFLFGGQFNEFIEPAKSKTLNLGLNHNTERNKLKATLFYSRLKNEIYYFSDPTADYSVFPFKDNSVNTNIDKSHKYGLELQDRFQVTEDLTARANYAYTLAKIDREIEDGNNYGGKKLPGVSAHSITAGLDYQVFSNGTVSLTQNWRSRAYAANDFANNFAQKQKAFNSTDIGYSHNFEQFTLFAHVSNVFDKKNGISVHDDAIYPVTFTRTWHAGARISF